VGIRIGCLQRRLDDSDAHVAERTPHFSTPFPITIADEDAMGTEYAVICRRQRATDLPHEEIVWMRRRANDLHAT
jgi:hypothetical protein